MPIQVRPVYFTVGGGSDYSPKPMAFFSNLKQVCMAASAGDCYVPTDSATLKMSACSGEKGRINHWEVWRALDRSNTWEGPPEDGKV